MKTFVLFTLLSSAVFPAADRLGEAVTAVLELMAHEVNGKVEFFRGCPREWKDVSFENLALSDGTRIDGSRINGRVSVKRR